MHTSISLITLAAVFGFAACAHTQKATVLPKGGNEYEIIGQSSTEQAAYRNAESEGKYVCEDQEKNMLVKKQDSAFQGADKNSKGDVEAENVALAFFTGKTGRERNSDDYKVTLHIACE